MTPIRGPRDVVYLPLPLSLPLLLVTVGVVVVVGVSEGDEGGCHYGGS